MLQEIENKLKSGEDASHHSHTMERADSVGRADCMTQTQTQRELAPPWNFNDTEHQLEIMK